MINNILIQARMSSARYPGKMLAPINGIPLIKHLIDLAEKSQRKNKVIVVTSTEASDDPLVAYLNNINCCVFRGNLGDVFDRFRVCLQQYPCDYFVRICGDSPFLKTELIDALLEKVDDGKYDFISNVLGRTFPKGQSVEIAKTSTFLSINNQVLNDHEREHVMPYFYTNKDKYKTLFLQSTDNLGHITMCVDTLDDLKNLEKSSSIYTFDRDKLCIVT